MICNTTNLCQGTDLTSRSPTLAWGQHAAWPFLTLALAGGRTDPHGVSLITRVKHVGSQQNVQYPHIDQFDTCPENFDPLMWPVTELWRHISGDVRTKSADFAIYCVWASFAAFWSVLLHCRQHNWCLWISRNHIQLPWGQGLARWVPWAVSVVHFNRYNSNFTAVLSLGIIV